MRYRLDAIRGRPYGKHRSQADTQLLEYLAKVALKYDVNSDMFFNSLLDVQEKGKSGCGKLLIECRLRKKDYAIFLVTNGREVIGQFRVSGQLLNDKTNPLEQFVSRLSAMRTSSQEDKPKSCKIRDMKAGMKRLDLNASVIRLSQPVPITTRYGFSVSLKNALIADETGTISLSLFGSQIKEIALHDMIQIENAHVAWFRGERQLRVGRRGRIRIMNPIAD